MREQTNRQVLLNNRPSGYPKVQDFHISESDIPVPHDGEVLIRTIWLSLDPYMRGRMKDEAGAHPLNQPLPGGTVGKVIVSNRDDTPVGLIVEAHAGWQDFMVSDGRGLRPLDPTVSPISTALGILGMPGLTAYHGLFEIGHPKAGETVVVSAASGAVGGVVCQLAKLAGCQVVGIAGSDRKIDYLLHELGLDSAINYNSENISDRLRTACPNGVDVYFDNVGGPITDSVLSTLAYRARVIICGQISQYNLDGDDAGPRNLWTLLQHNALVEGFTVNRFSNLANQARDHLAKLVNTGRLQYKEDIVTGLENAPAAFVGLMKGENFGKLLIKVSEDLDVE